MIGRMTYADLLQTVTEKTGASKKQVLEVMRGIVDAILYGLERDGRVVIRGLGRFELRWQESRLGRHPVTGEEIEIPAHSHVHFKPESGLRKFINRKYSHLKPKMLSEQNEDDSQVIRIEPIPVPEDREQRESSADEESRHGKRTMRWLWLIPILVVIILLIWFWSKSSDGSPETGTDSESAVPQTVEKQSTPADEKPDTEPFEGIPRSTHQIRAGDRLWEISTRYYGNAYLWPYIHRENAASMQDPDMLEIGKTIAIPPLERRPGQLSATDKINIADGYLKVYLAYQQKNKTMRHTYLWVAKQTGGEAVLEEYSGQIDEEDMNRASALKGNVMFQ